MKKLSIAMLGLELCIVAGNFLGASIQYAADKKIIDALVWFLSSFLVLSIGSTITCKALDGEYD